MNTRRSILLGGVIAALCLLVAVGWTALTLERTAHGLVIAEATEWTPRASAYEPTEEGLARLLADYPNLRWAAYAHPDGEVLFEAGARPTDLGGPRRGPIRRLPDGSILAFSPPPRPLLDTWAGPGRPPPLVTHFEPELPGQLTTRGRTTLAMALIAAVLLVLASTRLGTALEGAQQAQAELREHEHLAQMGEMSAVLAHEIKNPLASLKGHAQLLEELLEDSAHQRRARRVVGEAQRLQDLIESLLAYARKAEIHRHEVDVQALLAELVKERDQVQVDVPNGLVWSLDRSLIQRSVQNLVVNALQASGDAPVDVTVRATQDRLSIAVRDRGPGLEGKTPEALFVPFATTRTRGTGLGLAIAQRIARAHGGQLHAVDHPDGGAVFTLEIGAE